MGERRLEFVRMRPQPASIPIYFEIQVDDAGRIWVQDHPIEGPGPWKWTVLDSIGRARNRSRPRDRDCGIASTRRLKMGE
jgi:hypothetical protein